MTRCTQHCSCSSLKFRHFHTFALTVFYTSSQFSCCSLYLHKYRNDINNNILVIYWRATFERKKEIKFDLQISFLCINFATVQPLNCLFLSCLLQTVREINLLLKFLSLFFFSSHIWSRANELVDFPCWTFYTLWNIFARDSSWFGSRTHRCKIKTHTRTHTCWHAQDGLWYMNT